MTTNKWFVRFRGTSTGMWIATPTMAEAKEHFARLANVPVSIRIVAHRKKPKGCADYIEPAICSARFARGEPYECEV